MRVNKRNLRNIIYILLVFGAVYTMVYWFLLNNKIILNWTPSHVPVGLYRIIDTEEKTYVVGDIVLFNIDELYKQDPKLIDMQSVFVSRTFIKIVGAIAGDKMSRSDDGKVTINGETLQNAVIHTNYDNGELRCKIQYPLTIPDEHVWLVADREFSFDSRYFGSVPNEIIFAKVEKLWTWR